MKKLLLIAAMVVSTVAASAQNAKGHFSLKPMAGVSITNLTNYNNSNFKPGFVGGVEAEYGISDKFGLSLGVLFSMQGNKGEDKEDGMTITAKNNLNYINIPILAKIYVAPGFAIQAGIQPGFLASAKLSIDNSKQSASVDIMKGCNKVDFSIPVGLSYEFANLVLDARYNIGVTRFNKNDEEMASRNSVFAITLGYRFSL